MSKRKAQIIVLCEDKQQEVCARHFLIAIGFDRNKMFFRTCPIGFIISEAKRLMKKQHIRNCREKAIANLVLKNCSNSVITTT